MADFSTVTGMRVLVFAHVPPPFHGQSYMVQLMLENLGNPGTKDGLAFFHVNARLSDGLDDIGVWRVGKFFRLTGYIVQAWWMRWKYSIDAFYYIPAPPAKRSALYRDWLVLGLVSFLFKVRIFHWHAVGLGESVREAVSAGPIRRLEASITRRLLLQHDMSCVLNDWGRRDVGIFSPRHVAHVANGIPDPCPDFEVSVLPGRLERANQLSLAGEEQPACFQLLYLAHATRSKGLFDSLEAVAQANALLQQNESGWRVRLTVAGAFFNREEEEAFRERIGRADLQLQAGFPAIFYAGHVGPQEKERLLCESDALCFASYFPNEGQPVSIIEALAHGMPVVLSRWRALPEMVSSQLAHLVDPADPAALARAIILLAEEKRFVDYRKYFLEHYSLASHIGQLRTAMLSLTSDERT